MVNNLALLCWLEAHSTAPRRLGGGSDGDGQSMNWDGTDSRKRACNSLELRLENGIQLKWYMFLWTTLRNVSQTCSNT